PLDDNFYFIDMVYQHWRLTQDRSFLRAPIQTASGEMPLIDLCDRVFRAIRTSPVADLVITSEIDNAKDWGFCDAVTKSGSLLFPSILRSIAAHHLSKLFTAIGDDERAKLSHLQSASTSFGIAMTFLAAPHRSDNSAASEAWLHSATEVGNQPDVWGSAFAVASRIIQAEAAARVSRALVRAYREKNAVRDGLVRHILTTDTKNNAGWEKSISPVGEYQNGGYWSTPSGWYIAAMHLTDPAAARDMARDLVRTLRSWTRDDGTTRAWEWSNPDTGRQANDLYAASVALPWITLKNANLLGLLRDN
ncbi:MAG: hypothetical protein JNL50_00670, partial [Phycisphaerae bacterium]|nr:hypothetical protein [Phycisphaerae bacterium]